MSVSGASRPPTGTKKKPNPLLRVLRDVFYGAVFGDYSPPGLGMAAVFTRIVLGYFPVVGTLCAMRDYFANREHGDRLGAVLCLLAIFPVLGGFPLTAEIVRNVRVLRFSRKMHKGMDQATGRTPLAERSEITEGAADASHPTHTGSNHLAVFSAWLAALAPVVVLALWAIFSSVTKPLLAPRQLDPLFPLLGFSLLVPLLIIVLGHMGSRRAKKTVSKEAHRGAAMFAQTFGWLYLVFVIMVAAVIALLAHFNLVH